jgi:hypothetical protein
VGIGVIGGGFKIEVGAITQDETMVPYYNLIVPIYEERFYGIILLPGGK